MLGSAHVELVQASWVQEFGLLGFWVKELGMVSGLPAPHRDAVGRGY